MISPDDREGEFGGLVTQPKILQRSQEAAILIRPLTRSIMTPRQGTFCRAVTAAALVRVFGLEPVDVGLLRCAGAIEGPPFFRHSGRRMRHSFKRHPMPETVNDP